MTVTAWGPWNPDVSSYQGQHTEFLQNVLPRGDGYGPINNFSAFSDALGAACRGAFLALDDDGTLNIFAGTATALFKMSNADLSWEDVTRASGGAYTLGADAQWQFAQSGVNVIAVNGTDAAQRYQMGVSTDFAVLAGSPPVASYVTTVNEFLVLSGLSANPYRIAWSARSDITGWTPGTNGSDIQDFNDGGIVRGVAGGEWGWVFQDNCIRRMTFVAGDVGFEFDRLTEGSGLQAPYSLIRAADRVFYLSHSGFEELISASGQINKLGKEKFDKTFFAEWDAGEPRMMIGSLDPQSTRVVWFYKTKTGATGLANKAIYYDWALQRATPLALPGIEYVAALAQIPVTLDSLPTYGYADIDAMTISLDEIPTGDLGVELGLFDTTHALGFLSGATLEAILETSRSALDTGQRVFVRATRPDSDAGTVFGSVFARQRLTDTEVQSTESALNAIGFCPHRVDGRVMGFRNRIPAATSWTYSIGIEAESAMTGQK